MTGAVHTPWPFEYVPSVPLEGVECYWIRAPKSLGSQGLRMIDVASVNGPQGAEQEAIAILFSIAPELLRALENLTNAASATTGFASPMFLKDAQDLLARIQGGAA